MTLLLPALEIRAAKYEMTRHNAGFLAMDLLSIEEGLILSALSTTHYVRI